MSKKNKIAIVTFTFARAASEKQLILKTLKSLSQLNYPLVVADQIKSRFPLISELREIKNVRVFQGKNFNERIRKGLAGAAKLSDSIFYLEADKYDFADRFAQKFIDSYLKNQRGTLVPARSLKSFQRYPKFQQEMENFLIKATAAATDQPITDIVYGPRIFPSLLVDYLKKVNGKINFGFQAFLLVINRRLGLPLKKIDFDVCPPPDVQKGKDLILYRINQARDYLEGLRQGYQVKLQ